MRFSKVFALAPVPAPFFAANGCGRASVFRANVRACLPARAANSVIVNIGDWL